MALLTVLMSILIVLLLLAYFRGLLKHHFWVLLGSNHSTNNPFKEPKRKPKSAVDSTKRNHILKQNFSSDKIPSELDAIVIGSGVGGLTVAAILAKCGKRVLALEQCEVAGGCCRTFCVDEGFEFDVGVHSILGMGVGTINRLLVDQLCDGEIDWVNVSDTAILGTKGDLSVNPRTFPIPFGRGALMPFLLERFPSEESGIRRYCDLLEKMKNVSWVMGVLKLLPRWFAWLVLKSGLLRKMVPMVEYWDRSVTDVLNELTDDEDLKAVLAYYGIGTAPNEASFLVHASVVNHITYGGYYPKGGCNEIVLNFISTIEKAGGRVLVRARVTDILMDRMLDRVTGVQINSVHTVSAPMVISDAGLLKTFNHLLPHEAVPKFGLSRLLKSVRPAIGSLIVFIGLKEELGLKANNVWAWPDPDMDKSIERYNKLSPEEAPMSPAPLIFLSSLSAKDPTYKDRNPAKPSCTLVTQLPYEWFEQWKDKDVMNRGDDYHALKMAIGRKLWSHVCEVYPHFKDKVEYFDVATPLTNEHYLNNPHGGAYGMDHSTSRYSPEMVIDVRPDIGIPGLYLTGEDVVSTGFPGAMYGGLLCASTLLKRNLFSDILDLRERMKKLQ